MCRYRSILALVCLSLSACGQTNLDVVSRPSSGGGTTHGSNLEECERVPSADLRNDLIVGEPIRHANLTIFPILSANAPMVDRFITLDEGLRAGTVEVFEVGAEAVRRAGAAPEAGDGDEADGTENDVNRLMVVNRSDKPLYLMPGEVIVGGSQDRTIGEERVIAADGQAVPIGVFCVEHGRWGERDVALANQIAADVAEDVDHDSSAPASASRSTREHQDLSAAQLFVAKAGYLGKGGRMAAQVEQDQQRVWDEVEASNSASGVEPFSGTVTLSLVCRPVTDQLRPYLDVLTAPIADTPHVVGVIVAINGQPEMVDVFESTPLFLKLWPKLVRSYALDAEQQSESEEAATVCDLARAREFLDATLHGESEATPRGDKGLIVTRRSTEGVVSFALEGAAAPAMMGGFGGAVHTTGYSQSSTSK